MLHLISALIAMLTDVLSGLYFIYWKAGHNLGRYMIALASGVVISAAFFELLPEAQVVTNAHLIALGFFIFYMVEKGALLHACGEEECEVHSLGRLTVLGMALDNVIDGAGITVGYLVDPALGLIITAAVVAHEIPQGISTAFIMRAANRSTAETLGVLAIAGVMYPVGALLGVAIPSELHTMAIAFVAGVFIYVGAGDLLMEAHRRFSWKVIASVVAGALIVYLMHVLLA